MSLITDLRAVSENAVEQIAARFSDLPRPLLAAIGAGDMAVERLADLRESLTYSITERVSAGPVDVTDVRGAVAEATAKVSDLPAKAQRVAADVAGSIEQFAAEAPAKAQELIAQLPQKLAEFQAAAQSLSPDAVKETVEAYTQLVGMIYENLADRGDKTWTKVRASGLHPGAIVDAAATRTRPAKAAPKAAAKAPAAKAPRAAAKPTATKVAAPKPRAPRTPAPKAAAKTAPKAAAPTSAVAAPKPARKAPARKPAAPKPAASKPAGKPVETEQVAAVPAVDES